MTDLISRAEAIEEIARRDTTNGTVKVYSGIEVNAILSDLPAVDAVPVEWMREKMRGYASSLKSTETAALVMVMQMWQKEQEER